MSAGHEDRVAAAALMVLLSLLLVSCTTASEEAPPAGAEVDVEVIAEGLAGPTAMAAHPDGTVLVAQIGDGEATPTGSVVAVDLLGGEPAVLVVGLDTPTGIAIAGGHLWIMERTQLSRVPLEDLDAATVGAEQVTAQPVLTDLPSNGRSNGDLTTTAAGDLVYNTSGRREGFGAAEGSGRLWLLPGGDPEAEPRVLLEGMKNAYAVAELAAGTLAVTEIGDGRFDDAVPLEEVVLLSAPAPSEAVPSGGWPRCIDDRVPVIEFEGSEELCAQTLRPHALLPERATPTGIAVAPWDAELLVVTEWVSDRVVTVPAAPDSGPHEPTLLVGISTPQDLLVLDGRLLVTSHTGGQILSLSPAAAED